MNRIRGLLNLQGVRHIDPNRSNWENELVNLRTGGGRSFPRQLMNEVCREGKLLIRPIRVEIAAAMLAPSSDTVVVAFTSTLGAATLTERALEQSVECMKRAFYWLCRGRLILAGVRNAVFTDAASLNIGAQIASARKGRYLTRSMRP
jgi:hypothetical protein